MTFFFNMFGSFVAPGGVVMTYLSEIPAAIPRGKVVVHNHVKPAPRLGERGFPAWLQKPEPSLVKCDCGWGPKLGVHYRVAARKAGAR